MPWIVRFGAFVFRYRDGLFPAVLFLGLAISPPTPVEAVLSIPVLALAVGAFLALAGEALRLAVIGHAYIERGGKHGRAYVEELVREGLFAHARHPLYTGNLLIAFEICLMYGTPYMVVFGISLFLLVYVAMALNEEAFLLDKFGDEYRDYMASVPRFIPDFRGISESLAGFEYDWRRALRKDYGQIALPLFAIVVFVTWRMRIVWPWVVAAGAIAGLATLVAYIVVRTLKLRGRLESPGG